MCEGGLAKSGPKGEGPKWGEAVQGWGEEKLAKAWHIGRHNSVVQALGKKKERTNCYPLLTLRVFNHIIKPLEQP